MQRLVELSLDDVHPAHVAQRSRNDGVVVSARSTTLQTPDRARHTDNTAGALLSFNYQLTNLSTNQLDIRG